MKYFLKDLVIAHFSLVAQELEWHLYPAWTADCCWSFVHLSSYVQKQGWESM